MRDDATQTFDLDEAFDVAPATSVPPPVPHGQARERRQSQVRLASAPPTPPREAFPPVPAPSMVRVGAQHERASETTLPLELRHRSDGRPEIRVVGALPESGERRLDTPRSTRPLGPSPVVEGQMAGLAQEVAGLRRELEQVRAAQRSQRGDLTRVAGRLDGLRNRLARHEAHFSRLERAIERSEQVVRVAERKFEQIFSRVGALSQMQERVRALELVSRKVKQGDKVLRGILGTRAKQSEDAVRRAEEAEARLAALEEEFGGVLRRQSEALDREASWQLRCEALEATVASLTVGGRKPTAQTTEAPTVAQAPQAPVDSRTHRVSPSERPSVRPSLREIHGIGPRLEGKLRDGGVCTPADIAAWREEDLQHWGKRLGLSVAAIRRAQWVAQAQRLVAR